MSKLTFLVCALALATACAEEAAPQESAKERGAKLCQTLAFSDKVLGKTEYGIYVNGTKNIGSMSFDIAAGDKEQEAAYAMVITGQMAMGPAKHDLKVECQLAAHGGIITQTVTETDHTPEGSSENVTVTERVDGNWVESESEGEEETIIETDVTGENHGDLSCAFLLARVLDLTKATSYELAGVEFSPEEGEPHATMLTVTVGGEEDFDYRGKSVKVRRLTLENGDETHSLLCHDSEGVLAVLPDPEAPIVMIRGTAETIKTDIASAAAPTDTSVSADGKAASPTAAVITYMNVLAHESPADALDAVMDWQAVFEEMGAENEAVKTTMDAEMIGKMMKRQLGGGMPSVTKDQIEVLAPMLVETIDGDKATVDMPGAEGDPFRLRKDGEEDATARLAFAETKRFRAEFE